MDYHRPKKSLGQNFLIDHQVLARIVDAVDIHPTDHLLEIGPGRGALTHLLEKKAAKIVAVELDRQLVAHLKETFSGNENVEICYGDILRLDLSRFLSSRWNGKWKIAANLPYNISSQVLFSLLDNRELFSTLVLMFQKEVGERLLAVPGGKNYGILSLLIPLHFDVRKVTNVKPGAFFPVPKVDSVVLRFDTRSGPRIDVGDESVFRRLVKGAFAQRRKTLFNALKSSSHLDEADLRQLLSSCGIDGGRRGETLSLDEFASLARTALVLNQKQKME